MKTLAYTVQADMNASTAFKYDTGGKEACDLACWVDKVRSEVTPRVTRAGAASGLIQKETHCKKRKNLWICNNNNSPYVQ